MNLPDDVLLAGERAILSLRALYRGYGYTHYRMSRFEEYDLYGRHKSFLVSDNVITFTGADGRLMALRPDVTLSIVKSADDETPQKLYYNENVYRPSADGREFTERMQVGLEYIGEIGVEEMSEVILLAQRSLAAVGTGHRLGVSHMGFISALLDSGGLADELRAEALRHISGRSASGLAALCRAAGCDEGFTAAAEKLAALYGPVPETLPVLRAVSVNERTDEALRELQRVYERAVQKGADGDIYIDFSIGGDMRYYNGLIFQGFLEGIPAGVLSGGRYDNLMRRFGKRSGAIGFAVYLDLLERFGRPPDTSEKGRRMINIALPKGRLGDRVYALFEAAGYGCPAIREDSRRLVFENEETGVRYFWVKPSDVASYVERGAADIGVAGRDVLLEYAPDVYELLDLGIGRCRMAVAAKRDFTDDQERTLRVATKFPAIARGHYARRGREIDIIRLSGSIELAPLLGLSDVIVDIVETGKTLLENGLVPVEDIVPISARLIANKASFKFKNEEITNLSAAVSRAGGNTNAEN